MYINIRMLIFENLIFKYELKLGERWEWETLKHNALFEIITHYPISDRKKKKIDAIRLRKTLEIVDKALF